MTAALLTAAGLYRATCDPTPVIDRPEGGIELRALRRKHSKSFLLPSGLHRQIISIGPQHWWAGDQWRTIRTQLEAGDAQRFECWRTPYLFQNLPNRIGCDYKSRSGGFARMRLVEVGGEPIRWTDKPDPQNNCLHWQGVALDCDVHLQLLPAKVQAWTTIRSAASPRRFTWEFCHRPGVRIAENVRGWDAAGNHTEIITRQHTERLSTGVLRTRLEKEWTGRVFNRKNERREKVFCDPVYPVVLDPDISEEIVAENDDGREAYTSWYNTVCGISNNWKPGWRFQGIAVNQADTIDLANFKIYLSSSGYSGTSPCKIYAWDTDDAAAFSNTNRPTQLTKTAAYTSYTFPQAKGQCTAAVTSAVQEVVDRAGFASGNDLSLFAIQSSGGAQNFSDYPATGKHGRLEIDYTGAAAGGQPTMRRWQAIPGMRLGGCFAGQGF